MPTSHPRPGRGNRFRRISIVSAFMMLLTSGAAASPHPPPRLISGKSPFAGCRSDSPLIHSEYDQVLAADPQDASRLTGVWYQDDQAGLIAASSNNGGRSWSTRPIPGFTSCGGDDRFTWVFDPWASVGADGRTYVVASAVEGDPSMNPPRDPLSYAAIATTSDDGGATWSDTKIVARLRDAAVIDHTSVTADPRTPGKAWLMFTGIIVPGISSGIFISSTSDGGQTWSEARPTIVAPPSRLVIGSAIQPLPDGNLAVVYAEMAAEPLLITGTYVGDETVFKSQLSADDGETWSDATTIGRASASVFRNPDSGQPLVRGGVPFTFPSVAAAQDGSLHIAWAEIESPISSSIRYGRSLDGATWEQERTVLEAPAQAFTPTVAASAADDVTISFYDFRNDIPGDSGGWTTDVWLRRSTDGGRSWSEAHLGGPFDYSSAATGGGSGFAHGDYFGLVNSNSTVVATFTMSGIAAIRGITDVYAAVVAKPSITR